MHPSMMAMMLSEVQVEIEVYARVAHVRRLKVVCE
jgi:hypothetical protein